MHFELIIKKGMLVTPVDAFKADIAVSGGKIIHTGKLGKGDTADVIYDANGKYILPGIIDAHVHFRDPGLTDKEDFETGSMAAAMGGITTVFDMPNVIPPTSTAELFKEKVKIAKEKSYVDFGFYALLTNDNTLEMEGLKDAGALGFKIFLGTSTGDIAAPSPGMMIEQMITCAELGLRTGFHAETSELNSHFTSLCKEIKGAPEGLLLSNARPVISEALAIQTAIFYAQYTGAKIHIHHVTSLDGFVPITEAKNKGINVTSETCPHYLLFNAHKCAHKVYPPIREEKHRKGLWELMDKGFIDIIASDHAPHTEEEKAMPLWEAPAGLSGVETFVPILLNEVNNRNLSLNDIVLFASESPAKIWGLYPRKGNLLPGSDADFTIVDMKKKAKISAGALHSKSKTSPYDGTKIQGMPVATIVRGKFIMKDGELTGTKGFGSHLIPAL